jgi:hypothetical protein
VSAVWVVRSSLCRPSVVCADLAQRPAVLPSKPVLRPNGDCPARTRGRSTCGTDREIGDGQLASKAVSIEHQHCLSGDGADIHAS